MKYHLIKLVSTFIFAFTSYQCAQASTTTFTSKSIQIGDNLLSLLRKHGFTQAERERVLASDPGLSRLFLTLDTKYLISQNGKNIEMRFFDSQTSAAFRIIKASGQPVRAFKYDPGYRISVLQVQGVINGSILGSILARVNSNWVATRFMDAYAFETKSGKALKRGAKYSFSVEKKYVGPHFVKYGEVLQTSLEIGSGKVHKKFVRHNGGGVFINHYDLLKNKPLYAPVDYLRIASHFQPNRLHPITRRKQPHLGVDFEGPIGKPIFAPKSGVVLRYGHNRAAGNYIVLLHSGGIETSYNHLRKIDSRIRQGVKVSSGEKIGEMGCTGYCTRAHLHFAVKKKGHMVDPLKFIKAYPSFMESAIHERVANN